MFYLLKRCQEKFFKNILSLLAGKSEQICSAFPLTTFLSQKLTEFTLQKFPPQNFNTAPRANFFCTSWSIKFVLKRSNTSNVFLQQLAHKATLQDKIQFIVRVAFYLLNKFLCCKEKYLLLLTTQKFIEQVDNKTHNKLNLNLQRNLVRE